MRQAELQFLRQMQEAELARQAEHFRAMYNAKVLELAIHGDYADYRKNLQSSATGKAD
jgi:hypothetical protein